MEPRSLQSIAESCGGELVVGDPALAVTRICTDSRQAQAGDLFVALRGERFDGHAFLAEVRARKVTAVLVEKHRLAIPLESEAAIVVENTRQALGSLAARYRLDFHPLMVVVGGSNGKTTTKELVASVLRQRGSVLASEASYNNDIGVPLTLLKLEKTHAAAVLEAGTNHAGELAPLVRMIQPKIGIITSLGREHLEHFDTLEGVIQEEGWLAELLPVNGKLFVPGDDPAMNGVLRRARARVIRVGFQTGNDWQASLVQTDYEGTRFQVRGAKSAWDGEYAIRLLGRHQVVNALLALAVGAESDLGREEIRRGLEICSGAKMRLQLWEANGIRVLNDAYNANADSVSAALETVHDLPVTGRRVAVLGEMAELGRQSESAHTEIGGQVARTGIDLLFTVGKMTSFTAAEARRAGVRNVFEYESVEQAAPELIQALQPGDLVLLKASRASRFERIEAALRAGWKSCFTI